MPQYVKKIEDYLIKDEEARNSLTQINEKVTIQTATINLQTEKINQHTDSITSLTNSVNNHTTKLTSIEDDLEALKGKEHLSMTYDSETETITFE